MAIFPRTLRFGLTVALVATGLCATAGAASKGVIETPAYQTTQSGVALISGWNCTGRRIQIGIDGGPLQTAGAHTSRLDTRAVCGQTDTGYGLLYNFNLLKPGPHHLVAYADGVAFAQQDFSTIRIDPAVNNDQLRFPFLNFPDLGMATTVVWDRELQNFRADVVLDAPALAGDYYGATTVTQFCDGTSQVEHATYSVTFDKNLMGVTIQYTDGETVTFPPTPAGLGGDGYVSVDFGEWHFKANGQVLSGGIRHGVDDLCVPDRQVRAAK